MDIDQDETDVVAELNHFNKIVNSFEQYRRYSLAANNRRRKDFYKIPLDDQALLKDYPSKLNEVDDRIRRNADVLDELVMRALQTGLGPPSILEPRIVHSDQFLNSGSAPMACDGDTKGQAQHAVTSLDAEKVQSTLRQLVRDWSSLGADERMACYLPILESLEAFASTVTPSQPDKSHIRVLVPGSGLGRLVWEIANRGYSAQGNEISYHMLLASNLILNHTEIVNQWTIYPFIHSFSNFSSADGLLQEVKIPDVLTSQLLNPQDFGVSIGEFTEIFLKPSEKEKWHALVTCFFLDTAQNIVKYIRSFHHLLKPNGIWINLGPTLWHHESSSNSKDTSIELDVLEIKELCFKMGFEFQLGSERVIETTYAWNPHNNLKQVYKADFWVALKRS